VDEFLREELNYVVVETWGAQRRACGCSSPESTGVHFLIHSDAQGDLFESGFTPVREPGVTPLRDAVRVLNGFAASLESILQRSGTAIWWETPWTRRDWLRAIRTPGS